MKLKLSGTVIALAFILLSCGTTKTSYQREYAKVWNEMLKSRAWIQSLAQHNATDTESLYVSSDTEIMVVEEKTDFSLSPDWERKYKSLVSQAYFKIITEAEKADARITAEYKIFKENLDAGRTNKNRIQEISKKYDAHKAMMSGLKSWNIFSEDRSGDLEYFMAENQEEIQNMMTTGVNKTQMINFLIYKLADLYHVEEN